MAGSRHPFGSRTTLFGGLSLFVAVAVGVAVFAVLSGGSGSGRSAAGGGSPSASPTPAPRFAFHIASVRVMPTGRKKGVKKAAHAAALDIENTLDTVYTTGFLDPRTWESGSYGGAWRAFTKEAIARARTDEPTLTLGARAGDVFTSITPHNGRLVLQILLDRKGHPSTAIADIGPTFCAAEAVPRITLTSPKVSTVSIRNASNDVYDGAG